LLAVKYSYSDFSFLQSEGRTPFFFSSLLVQSSVPAFFMFRPSASGVILPGVTLPVSLLNGYLFPVLVSRCELPMGSPLRTNYLLTFVRPPSIQLTRFRVLVALVANSFCAVQFLKVIFFQVVECDLEPLRASPRGLYSPLRAPAKRPQIILSFPNFSCPLVPRRYDFYCVCFCAAWRSLFPRFLARAPAFSHPRNSPTTASTFSPYRYFPPGE